ncbi:hypothetical protein [Candidatus Methylomicrobium oryzae]|uniref:hypothetical protein n=1 Tax=Candidatus Methylomicrobium oryzae TaxID=2802053 RepID=UPI00192213B7|nr:hypothetical protein [Methylomicrobium sp. RS1]MBL1266111.1 hypothetical protein [Methylomicrobium sp. RS1]
MAHRFVSGRAGETNPRFKAKVAPELADHGYCAYGGKAYRRPDAGEIQQTQGLTELKPVKKQQDNRRSMPTRVSRVRQPRSLFSWDQTTYS